MSDRPRPDLLGVGGQVGLQAQGLVADVHQLFCTATGRRPRSGLDTRRWFDVAASGASYEEKIARDYFGSPDFDQVIVETIQSTFPAHEHEQFIAHYRGLLGAWVSDAAPGS